MFEQSHTVHHAVSRKKVHLLVQLYSTHLKVNYLQLSNPCSRCSIDFEIKSHQLDFTCKGFLDHQFSIKTCDFASITPSKVMGTLHIKFFYQKGRSSLKIPTTNYMYNQQPHIRAALHVTVAHSSGGIPHIPFAK